MSRGFPTGLLAAETILELDRLWRDYRESDHLTSQIAKALYPRSLRGDREDTYLSQQAWWLAYSGKANSARVLLETFQPEDRWAELAGACLGGEQPSPAPLSNYRGKLRDLVKQIRQGNVENVVSICQPTLAPTWPTLARKTSPLSWLLRATRNLPNRCGACSQTGGTVNCTIWSRFTSCWADRRRPDGWQSSPSGVPGNLRQWSCRSPATGLIWRHGRTKLVGDFTISSTIC